MHRLVLMALPLALSIAGCRHGEEPIPTITHVEFAGATALVMLDGGTFAVAADGSAHPLAADTWTVHRDFEGIMGNPSLHCVVRNPTVVPWRVGRHVGLYFVGGEVLEGGVNCAYFKATALADLATGSLGWLAPWDPNQEGAHLAEDGAGRVHANAWGTVYRYRLDGASYLPDARLSALDHTVKRFWVGAGGDVAYAALVRAGNAEVAQFCLKPASGPLAVFDGAPGFSEAWRGPDGELRILRTTGASTELLRLDFGDAPALTPLASWTARSGELDAVPATAGGLPVLVEPDRLRVFADADAAPTEVALPFAFAEVHAAFGALWFTAGATKESLTRAVRWTPTGGFQDLLPASGHEVRAVVPHAAASALVRVRRTADGAELWLRASPGAAPAETTALPAVEVWRQAALD